ncbi:alpha/beta fold hydrolase [Streptomyces sp. NPDC058394]|uniref:alpha/beta fold hydrolase n=1 Tax=Streptomyces sp. NPDC058394 TaxID=3346477 RepID=UPI0036660DBB
MSSAPGARSLGTRHSSARADGACVSEGRTYQPRRSKRRLHAIGGHRPHCCPGAWELLARAGMASVPFGERFRCLALDLPGHGGSASGRNPDAYPLPDYASLLAGLVTELDADDPVLVGWGPGGHIALEAAERLPEAAGFVLFGTPPVGSPADVGRALRVRASARVRRRP